MRKAFEDSVLVFFTPVFLLVMSDVLPCHLTKYGFEALDIEDINPSTIKVNGVSKRRFVYLHQTFSENADHCCLFIILVLLEFL